MFNRRKALKIIGSVGLLPAAFLEASAKSFQKNKPAVMPVVISTWDAGINANAKAWEILTAKGTALDAVEKGVMITESEINCCVGLSGNPDRDGIVTLDACIMDELGNCGSVAALEQIAHPISVARAVMEKTPHVMLVGEGAQQFAVSEGFKLEGKKLSVDAEKAYKEWLKTSQYKPIINIENTGNKKSHGPFAPNQFDNGDWNHDTIGMVALDIFGNLSGACTTSGMGFKMRGRVGDSPIIGAGLFVDNEVGAATATGHGEEVIRVAGCHLVVELMRQGKSPEEACKGAVERIYKWRGDKLKDKQVGFIAINKNGEHGAYCLQSGFSYALYTPEIKNELFKPKSLF